MALDPAALLSGPRGRRLCLEFACSSRDIAHLLAQVPLPEPTAPTLLDALTATVVAAQYWQEPDGTDVLAAAPELQEPLARVARHLLASPNTAWWSSPMERNGQWVTTFTDTDLPESPSATTAHETLAAWRDAQQKEERIAERDWPADPAASWSGPWWSKPTELLTHTTRRLPGRGPARLSLIEDSLGWRAASVEPIHVPADPRVYEIDGAAAWADLCSRYPLEVTASRRHDWYRITGRAGSWVIPDWSRLQRDVDAVHLTVGGYLSTAGRAISVDGERAGVLAGWDPDQTYWLHDVTRDPSRREHWTCENDEWSPPEDPFTAVAAPAHPLPQTRFGA